MDPTKKETTSAEGSEDLSELLDSCLDDFNKPLPKVVSANAQPPKPIPESSSASTDAASADWSADFKQFADAMENMMASEEGGEFGDLKQWMGSLQQGVPPDENFAKSFADTIKELTEQAQNIPDTTPDDLANLLSGFDFGDAGIPDSAEMPEIMPLMQNVMQKMMSKELLYPSLKEIVDKYPDWLSQKTSLLKPDELDNYTMQHKLMAKVCEEFEKEEDGSEQSKEQFQKILTLMQKIQTCGNPPPELISSIGPGVPLDSDGNLNIPGMPQQCAIM